MLADKVIKSKAVFTGLDDKPFPGGVAIKDGKILEEGSHKELIEQKGYYADLVNLQIGEISA